MRGVEFSFSRSQEGDRMKAFRQILMYFMALAFFTNVAVAIDKNDRSYGPDKTVTFFSPSIGFIHSTIYKDTKFDYFFPFTFNNIGESYAIHAFPYYSKREKVHSFGLDSYFQFFLLREVKTNPHLGLGLQIKTYFGAGGTIVEFTTIPRFGVMYRFDKRGSFVDPYVGFAMDFVTDLARGGYYLYRGLAIGAFSDVLLRNNFGVGVRMEWTKFLWDKRSDQFAFSFGPAIVF
jgi:hypothetical protein